MNIIDKISSLITGSKPEKREPEKVSSSSAEKPVEIVKKPARPAPIIEKKPQRVIVVPPVIDEPKTVSIKRAAPESVAHYPTKADFCGNIPLDESNYSRYRKATIMLPEFDFYTGRNCDVYDENSVEAQTIKELDQWAAAKQGEALALEEGREYDKAAAIYEELIHHRYWDTEPYHRLYNIYRKAGLTREATNLSQMAAAHFRRISQEQKRQLQNLADHYKSRAYTEKVIGALAYSSSVKPLTKNLSLTINDLCFLYSRSSPVSKKRWKYISANCIYSNLTFKKLDCNLEEFEYNSVYFNQFPPRAPKSKNSSKLDSCSFLLYTPHLRIVEKLSGFSRTITLTLSTMSLLLSGGGDIGGVISYFANDFCKMLKKVDDANLLKYFFAKNYKKGGNLTTFLGVFL